METKGKKRKRQTLADMKTQYSVEGQLKLDMSLVHSKIRKRSGKIQTVKNSCSSSTRCEESAVQQEVEINDNCTPDNISSQSNVKCSTSVFDLPNYEPVDRYRKAVIETDSFMVLDDKMSIFIVLDYDFEKNVLKNVPQLVSRKDELFLCMCDKDRVQFIDNFCASLDNDPDQLYRPCMHIEVARQLYAALLPVLHQTSDPVSDHKYSMTKLKEDENEGEERMLNDGDICEIPFLADHYAVVTKGSCTVLKVTFGSIKCLFCTGRCDCQHISWMNSLLAKYESCDLPEILDQILNRLEDYRKKDQYQLICESFKRIPFKLNHHMKQKISTQAKDLFLLEDGQLKAISMDITCPYCRNELPPDCLEEKRSSKLFTKYTCLDIMCMVK